MKRNRIINRFYKTGIAILGLGMFWMAGCQSSGPAKTDTLTSGTIHISADESFKPVIDSQIKVFESQNANAKIIVHYKPEAECLRDLNDDSTRVVIVTRGLEDAEGKTLAAKLSFTPGYGVIAYDAIAVIVNNQVRDTLFTMQDIRGMVKGTSGFKYKVLLDGTTATSTVRFVTDSLLKGQPMSKNVVAAASSEGVIDYVSKNTDAIGLIGVSWIGNQDDSTQLSFLQKVKIAKVECKGCDGVYVDPVQYNIAAHRYPMVRPLYYILKENYQGLGSGFTNFLIYEKGQKIFYRAYLLPARMQFEVRDMKITQ
ncbi:substrate-binding domain-containing protein [Paraflavitalea speifideaquila]|uniref:PstS family phosphate ABC transporter substrate-binding protein n=1 Tax=Paraflavitalea speifideaquila TaxID=3076558 RepID=UPI0028E8DD67|nr:substrate-binding domain-containing protein [Paraflavitalea speifideiaquila]